ncbi:hypothetical protein ARMGADRAFT_1032045 [Armillaria gallica]|uniref:Uncharacterized protein n=1 Tax=Armillaria gallica TaxID=47427 RepID=A0A2H3DA18_ARMGA|nr:hypothetical protein ARMGADRAFT_1032045 [Armillaria gallica]
MEFWIGTRDREIQRTFVVRKAKRDMKSKFYSPGKVQKDFARWKFARNPSPRPTVFSLFSVNSSPSAFRYDRSGGFKFLSRCDFLPSLSGCLDSNISFTVILVGDKYYKRFSRHWEVPGHRIVCNLYQVYINSQSNIHNGLQGRDGLGKAIVTVKNVAPGKLPTPAEASES